MNNQTKVIILVLVSIAVLGYVGVKVTTYFISQEIIERNDKVCTRLADDMAALEYPFNKTCSCHYSECGQHLEDRTSPFCSCTCIENNTAATICIRSV